MKKPLRFRGAQHRAGTSELRALKLVLMLIAAVYRDTLLLLEDQRRLPIAAAVDNPSRNGHPRLTWIPAFVLWPAERMLDRNVTPAAGGPYSVRLVGAAPGAVVD